MKTDLEIQEKILQALKWNTSVIERKVKVKIKKGIVTVNGEVEWEFQRTAIYNIIKKLTGVIDIINNIILAPCITSSEINYKTNIAFLRNSVFNAKKISIPIEGNEVIQTGSYIYDNEKTESAKTKSLPSWIMTVDNKLELLYKRKKNLNNISILKTIKKLLMTPYNWINNILFASLNSVCP